MQKISMDKYWLSLMTIAFFLIGVTGASAITTNYETIGYTSVPYNANTDRGITLNYTGTCRLSMESTNTFTAASPFISSLIYYSPIGTQLFISTTPAIQNTNCFSWGTTPLSTISKNATNGLYENSIIYTQSASSGYVTTGTKYVCDVTSPDYYARFFIDQTNDAQNYCLWRTRRNAPVSDGLRHTAWNNELKTIYNRCGDLRNWITTSCQTGTGGSTAGTKMTTQYIYPFNSSGGIVQYSFTAPSVTITSSMDCSGTYWIDLLNVENGTITNYKTSTYTCAGAGYLSRAMFTSASQSGILPLPNDKLFVWIVTWEITGGAPPNWIMTDSRQPVLNMSIYAYHPNYVCGSYSACFNGTQSRTCYDSNGIASPLIQPRTCYSLPQQSIFLGYDIGNPTNVWYCNEQVYDIITGRCGRSPYLSGAIPNLKPRSIPNGWYRNGYYANDTYGNTGWIEDYVDVTTDPSDVYAPDAGTTEGALKIWFIPKKLYVPVWNESGDDKVTCNATTQGQLGGVWNYINNSFWVSENISALSPYMSFSYRAKTCGTTEFQTLAYLWCSLGCGLAGNCANSGLCNSTGDDYYTFTGCPQTPPPSNLAVRIRDLNTGTDAQLYSRTITAKNYDDVGALQEDIINNMNVNHTYEISFTAYPANGILSNDANCVLIDDVNINFRNEPISCVGGCYTENGGDYNGDGVPDYTWIEATVTSTGSCQRGSSTFDPRCTPANVTADALAMQQGTKNQTCIGSTMVVIDQMTKIYTFIENNPTCIAEQEAAAPQNSYTTPMTGDTVVNTVANLVAMPIFFSFIIAMGIGAYVAKETKFWQIGVIFSLGLMTVFSLAGMFPIWFLFIVAIFAIAMFAYMMKAPAG